jgi:hypothetical protein
MGSFAVSVVFFDAEERMPYRKTRLNRTEKAECLRYLRQLQAEGVDVEIPSAWIDPSPDPDRLALEQIHHTATATIYDLPSSAVAIVLPARMTVLKAGLLVVDVAIMTPWDDFLLELIEPGESFMNEGLMGGVLPEPSPTILNGWLQECSPTSSAPHGGSDIGGRLDQSSGGMSRRDARNHKTID